MNKKTNEAKIPFIGLPMKDIRKMLEGKNIYTICKVPGLEPLNLIQPLDDSDIPEFLRPIVKIVNGKLVVKSLEGEETAELGNFVAYEESDSTECGFNAWIRGNALETTVEIDGKRYNKGGNYVLAEKMTTGPSELLGEDNKKVIENDDDSQTYPAFWGDVTGFPGKAYWVKYGENDIGILNKSEESYRKYILCDDDGNYLCYLHEFDPA